MLIIKSDPHLICPGCGGEIVFNQEVNLEQPIKFPCPHGCGQELILSMVFTIMSLDMVISNSASLIEMAGIQQHQEAADAPTVDDV